MLQAEVSLQVQEIKDPGCMGWTLQTQRPGKLLPFEVGYFQRSSAGERDLLVLKVHMNADLDVLRMAFQSSTWLFMLLEIVSRTFQASNTL